MIDQISRMITMFTFAGWSGMASAILIVDTGTTEVIQHFQNWTLDSLQYSAGIFTVDSSYTISSVEGWIGESNLGSALPPFLSR